MNLYLKKYINTPLESISVPKKKKKKSISVLQPVAYKL